MTFVVNGATAMVEQVRTQLDKVVETVKVSDITGDNVITRELAFIKVKANSANRSEIIQIVDIFRANIVDVAPDSVIIEATGDEDKINSLFNLLRGFGIKEIARTGLIAMTRGGAGPLPVKQKPPETQTKGKKTTK
jgi:acetolactate synthase-1/3 small subunit